MHVPRRYHRQVVGILSTAIAALSVALVVVVVLFAWPERRQSFADFPVDDPGAFVWEAPKSRFSSTEEIVVVSTSTDPASEEVSEELLPVTKVLFEYIRIIDSCGVHFEGDCVNVRSGPGTDFPVVTKLRNNVVLRIDGKVERDGHSWFRIIFDEWLRYPERVQSDWYISADFVHVLLDEGARTVWEHDSATTSKYIIVDRAEQMLYAYDGEELFMESTISTGLELSPTPAGTFTVYKKTPSRYMQGPILGISGSDFYDLPGVPWNLYFTQGGAVIHGAYWHDNFGQPWSHGCVNLPPKAAEKLYNWAPLGIQVTVLD